MALNLCQESCAMFYRLLILRSCSLSKMCGPNGTALHHSSWICMYPRLLAELHSTRGGNCERLQTAFEVHNTKIHKQLARERETEGGRGAALCF